MKSSRISIGGQRRLESEARKLKSGKGIAGVKGRDSRRTLSDRQLLS